MSFFIEYLQYKTSRNYFEQCWLGDIETLNETACAAFITFVQGQKSRTYIPFVAKVLNTIEKTLDCKTNTGSNLTLHLRVLVVIAEFLASLIDRKKETVLVNHIQEYSEFKKNLQNAVNKAVLRLQSLANISKEYSDLSIKFIIKLMEASFTSTYTPTGLFRDHILIIIELFESMVNLNFDFELDEHSYCLAFELIKLIARYYPMDTLIKDYGLLFVSLLFQIEYNLKHSDFLMNKKELDRLILFFEDKMNNES